MLAALVLVGCGAGPGGTGNSEGTQTKQSTAARPSTGNSDARAPTSAAGTQPSLASQGRAAASQRETFVPKRLRLLSDGGATTSIQGVDTAADGTLELPKDAGRVGWWMSGALAGELFGSVVLAGHIDSRVQGLGFFAKLLEARPGDRIELSDARLRVEYVVRSNQEVDKDVLSTGTNIFDRATPGRLVLITCTGRFDPRTRHYENNLVVVAEPVGAPTPL